MHLQLVHKHYLPQEQVIFMIRRTKMPIFSIINTCLNNSIVSHVQKYDFFNLTCKQLCRSFEAQDGATQCI
jgi:hypothetical protein